MRVEAMEIELASDQEYHRAHGVNAGVATRTTFGGLEQTIERFEETVGLPSLRPGDDTVEVIADHLGNLLHGFDFGAHDMGTPLRQQGRKDIDLFARENLTQLFTVQPGSRSTLGCDMSDQRIQIGGLTDRQPAPVLEQRPTHPFQIGIGLLLGTAHLVHRSRGMGDDVEFVDANSGTNWTRIPRQTGQSFQSKLDSKIEM